MHVYQVVCGKISSEEKVGKSLRKKPLCEIFHGNEDIKYSRRYGTQE